MPGTPGAELAVHRSIDALPADPGAVWQQAADLFSDPAWWRVVEAAGLEAGAAPWYGSLGGQALFPMRTPVGGRWQALTTPYTCRYAPLLPADPVPALAAFTRACRRVAVTRLDALPADWPHLPALLAAARAAGLVPLRFDHFGNWHEPVAGVDWAAYLASRPGGLRETIRRRLRRAERLPGAEFRLIDGAAGLEDAIAAFEAVYARSWKEPEPFARFNATLMRALAPRGWLRLGLWLVDGVTVAVQLWVVEHGRATVLKLAHDEAAKAHSPGTVLTALMLRSLFARDSLEEIDFGRGDDPYKQGWVNRRRQMIGVLLVNPRRPSGLAALARHGLGRLRARLPG